MKNPMEHLKQWHNLYQGILTPNETALYINIFMNANRRFWPEWIELTDSQLSLGTNISIKRIPDVINSLRQKGLITCERGKGKQISKYKICPFTKHTIPLPNYTQTGVINEVINGEINERKTGDKPEINRRYNGDKPEINRRLAKNSPCESKDGEASKTKDKDKDKDFIAAANARAKENFLDTQKWDEVVHLYEDCIHPIPNMVERDELIDMVQTDGFETVKEAIREAGKSRGKSVNYIQAILNRWRKEGQHGRSTGRGSRANQSADQEKRKWENEPNGWRQDLAI